MDRILEQIEKLLPILKKQQDWDVSFKKSNLLEYFMRKFAIE